MCSIKIGPQIKSMGDIQNLVTARVLRSNNPYTVATLTDEVSRDCQGSSVHISKEQLENIIGATTAALLRSKYISISEGYYYPSNISLK